MLFILSLTLSLARPSQALTWEDCAREAADRNPRVLAARRGMEAAAAARRAALAGYQPQLALDASETKTNTVFSGARSVFNGPASTVVSLGPELSWNLYSGGGTSAAVEAAAARAAQAEAELDAEEAALRFKLRRAFGQLLFAQETLTLTKAIAERLRGNAAFIRLKYQGGVEANWAALKADADAQAADWEAAKAALDLRAARRGLVEALGRPGFEELTAEGELGAPGPGPLEGALAAAEVHPSVRSRRGSYEAARARLRSARSGLWPSFDLSASYLWQGTAWSNIYARKWTAAAGLSWPLFSGGRIREGVRESERLLAAEENLLGDAVLSAQGDAESAYARYRQAADLLPVEKAQLAAAADRAETVKALYADGHATFLEWDASQSAYTFAQKSELSARLDAYAALAAWESALGAGF